MPCDRSLFALLGFVLLLLPAPAFGDVERKAYELKDGSVVVGEVIDEGDTAYLVRTTDGETVRIAYDQIERVTTLGGATSDSVAATTLPPVPPAAPTVTVEDHARARGVASRATSVVGVAAFSIGVGCSIAAGVWSITGPTYDDYSPGITLNAAGIAGMGVSIGLVSGSMRAAMDSHSLLFQQMDKGATAAFGVGIGFSVVGLSLVVATTVGAMENMPDYPPDWVIGTAVGGGIMIITGHIFSQAGAARLLDACTQELDSRLANNTEQPKLQFSGWLLPTYRGASAGIALRF